MAVSTNSMRIEAELSAPIAAVQLVQFHFDEPPDSVFHEDHRYRLDLCLTPRPRNARASYPERWGGDRFERLGAVFLVPPGEAMRARSDACGDQSSLLCQIDPKAMQKWFETDLTWDDRHLAAGLDIRNTTVQGLMMRLAEETKNPGFASEMLVELIAAQLGIELYRYQKGVEDLSKQGGLAPWRLRLIDERLKELPAMPTLAELADLVGLSVRQLTRGFRISRECSVGEYVAQSRVELAKQMLASEQSVKATAYTLGFSSPSSFCYAFRRATSETPGQYRQRIGLGR
ncbi:helix-turn-helix transcriptional regulator [Litorivivens sp.]|uniref:AraC family transcriptional regulator n=1 Tax=Litorivivens sp. TaxID=2020868 RepID=UPI003565496C